MSNASDRSKEIYDSQMKLTIIDFMSEVPGFVVIAIAAVTTGTLIE